MNDGLKQRIIGAFVLLALAAIFLPVVLNFSDERTVDTRSRIPTAPDIKPVTISEPSRVENVDPAPSPDQMFQLGVNLPSQGESLLDEAPGLDDDGMIKAWLVQVIAFSSEKKAREMSEQLKADGYKAFYKQGRTSSGEVFRVFVGPKVEKQKALEAKQNIDKKYGVKAIIIRFQP